MKLNVTQVLKDYQGKPVVVKTEDGEEKLTLRNVISTSVNATMQNKPMTGEQKTKAYQISVKVWGNKEVNLTVDQLAFIKEKVADAYNPLIYGRICDILDETDGKEEAAQS